MPAFLESKLKREAGKKGLHGRDAAHYIYGALNNMGAMHGSKITAKGEQMRRKHDLKALATTRKRK